jgi:hypothetical protein
MILEAYEILLKEGFTVQIGANIIISKDGFCYSMKGSNFLEMCKVIYEDSNTKENKSPNDGSERTYKSSD